MAIVSYFWFNDDKMKYMYSYNHQNSNGVMYNKTKWMYVVLVHEVMIIPPAQRSFGGVYWFHSDHPAVCLSVHPSCIPCLLCVAYSSGWIHFKFTYFISQLQKVCRIWRFLHNFKIWIFGNFFKFVTLTLSCYLMWITSMCNHGAAGGISERRHSSCSSSLCLWWTSRDSLKRGLDNILVNICSAANGTNGTVIDTISMELVVFNNSIQ